MSADAKYYAFNYYHSSDDYGGICIKDLQNGAITTINKNKFALYLVLIKPQTRATVAPR